MSIDERNISEKIDELAQYVNGNTYIIVKAGKKSETKMIYKYLFVDCMVSSGATKVKVKMLGTEIGAKTDNNKVSNRTVHNTKEARKEIERQLAIFIGDVEYLEIKEVVNYSKAKERNAKRDEIRKNTRENIPIQCLVGYFSSEDEDIQVEDKDRVEISYTEQKGNQVGFNEDNIEGKNINIEKDNTDEINIGASLNNANKKEEEVEQEEKHGVSAFFNKMKDKVEGLVDSVEESLDTVTNGVLAQSKELADDAGKQIGDSLNEMADEINSVVKSKKSDNAIINGNATEIYDVPEEDIMSDEEIFETFGVDKDDLDKKYEEEKKLITDGKDESKVEPNFNVAIPNIDLSKTILEYGKTIEERRTAEKEIRKIGDGCIKCNFTGHVTDPITGIVAICECQHREELKQKKEKEEQEKFEAKQLQLEIADRELFELLIPEDRRNSELQMDLVRSHISSMAESQDVKVRNFGVYENALNSIMTSITYGKLNRSYIIGAPNGYGKETMVYTAMKILLAQNKKVVPYKSLFELADLKADYEQRLLRQLRGSSRVTKNKDKKRFEWVDYLEADVLFTYLSGVGSKELESDVLYSILNIRAKNGLPTIVMASFPLDMYTKDIKLRKYYWDDMIAYKPREGEASLDRLIHVSCYKLYKADSFGAVKGVDY